MAAVGPEAIPGDPPYITYLLSPELCDCFFKVGKRELVEPERIGVVRKMLLAHSEVLRSDILAREMEEKKDIVICDVYPDTFKNLLRFIYGYDNTSTLGFEEADDLLYVAEKYMVKPLKARLSNRLIKLLNPENICSLLNNPACSRVLELDAAIRQILQYETDKVLASPQFLDLCCDALTKVVEQQSMNVPEIEVWRAAVRWAQHRTKSDSGEILRQELERPAKHIRVCTIDKDILCDEVFTTDILTREETKMVCLAKSEGVKQDALVCFSNEVDCRTRTSLLHVLDFDFDSTISSGYSSSFGLSITTKNDAIELLPLMNCRRDERESSLSGSALSFVLKGLKVSMELNYTIEITPGQSFSNNTPSKGPEIIEVSHQIVFGKEISIPLTRKGKNIILQPKTTYRLSLKFEEALKMYVSKRIRRYSDDHVAVEALNFPRGSTPQHLLPTNALHYRSLIGQV